MKPVNSYLNCTYSRIFLRLNVYCGLVFLFVFGLSISQAQNSLNNGLVAWYPFDGNASDMSGNGNHGTVNGATLSTDRHGQSNKAYSFDGVDDWIRINHSPSLSLTSFTLSLWFESNGTGPARPIIMKDNHTGENYSIWFESVNSRILSQFYPGPGSQVITERDIGPNQCYFVTSTFDNNTFKIFIDGDEEFSISSTQTPGIDTEPLYIGYDGGYGYNKIQGVIDDIRIYNRALSSEEVSALYRLESPNHFVEMNSTVNLEMIWAEPGSFTMGSPSGENGRGSNETQYNVTLTKGFYLGKYEVTQAQYEAVMTGNTQTDSNGDVISAKPSYWSGSPHRPVESVSWNDIQVFLQRLNNQQLGKITPGWAYVLPTEAQWE